MADKCIKVCMQDSEWQSSLTDLDSKGLLIPRSDIELVSAQNWHVYTDGRLSYANVLVLEADRIAANKVADCAQGPTLGISSF